MPSIPIELREDADVADGGEFPEDACRWAITMRDAADEIERLRGTLVLIAGMLIIGGLLLAAPSLTATPPPQKDTKRVIAAARLIIDGRNPSASMGEILTTLDAVVYLILLAVMDNNERLAAAAVEQRLALAASRARDVKRK